MSIEKITKYFERPQGITDSQAEMLLNITRCYYIDWVLHVESQQKLLILVEYLLATHTRQRVLEKTVLAILLDAVQRQPQQQANSSSTDLTTQNLAGLETLNNMAWGRYQLKQAFWRGTDNASSPSLAAQRLIIVYDIVAAWLEQNCKLDESEKQELQQKLQILTTKNFTQKNIKSEQKRESHVSTRVNRNHQNYSPQDYTRPQQSSVHSYTPRTHSLSHPIYVRSRSSLSFYTPRANSQWESYKAFSSIFFWWTNNSFLSMTFALDPFIGQLIVYIGYIIFSGSLNTTGEIIGLTFVGVGCAITLLPLALVALSMVLWLIHAITVVIGEAMLLGCRGCQSRAHYTHSLSPHAEETEVIPFDGTLEISDTPIISIFA